MLIKQIKFCPTKMSLFPELEEPDALPVVRHREHDDTKTPSRLDYYKKQIRTLTNKLQQASTNAKDFKRRYMKTNYKNVAIIYNDTKTRFLS